MLMKSITAAAFLCAAAATTAQADIGERILNMFDNGNSYSVSASGSQPRVYNRPPASFKGQWYTTADGCSYSRANPPGGAPTWHLILNPHHIGQPNAHRRCAPML